MRRFACSAERDFRARTIESAWIVGHRGNASMRGSADIFWRLVRATILLIALMVLFAFAPNAMTHGSHHASPGMSAAAPAFGASEAGAATYVQSASGQFADPDESCPEDSDDGHADHIGCCGGVVLFSSGGGGAVPPDGPMQVSAPQGPFGR